MIDYSIQNKKAWEYNAYEFWVKQSGAPADRAKEDLENPKGMLRKYADYFDTYNSVKIANICGSCGKKAVPLVVLGAEVTVFDISEDNKKYALEVAKAAKVDLNFEVCDILEIDMEKYGNYFDVVFMEGGVLHYFHDIDEFMSIMYSLLKENGKMICSDFHPFTKISDILHLEQPTMSYFSKEVFEGEMAHARFFEENIRKQMPKCSYRKYTMSEIINSVINSGFTLRKFDEHPAWTNEKIPGEFTIVARKEKKNITVCRLDRNMAEAYINYFDKRAFSDGSAEKGCYCVWHHWTERHEQERSLLPEDERQYCKRNYAKELVQNGTLNGFAAFCDDQIVGFCNSDLKDNYFRLSRESNPNSWQGVNENDKILSIVCFIVDPNMRRKGIAKALLDYACQYAEENGYDYVEGYPVKGEFTIKDCGGSASMYIGQGFEIIDIPNGIIARKKIKK